MKSVSHWDICVAQTFIAEIDQFGVTLKSDKRTDPQDHSRIKRRKATSIPRSLWRQYLSRGGDRFQDLKNPEL